MARGYDEAGSEVTPSPEAFEQRAPSSLWTTALDYGRFCSFVLSSPLAAQNPEVAIDGDLAWGIGWGIERSRPPSLWQWGGDTGIATFTLLQPESDCGVVILTNSSKGRSLYREIIETLLPTDHPSLHVEDNPTWIALSQAANPTKLT